MKDPKLFSAEEIEKKLEKYCSYQDRCLQEVRGKLGSFSVSPDIEKQVLSHLLEHGFLDEERFSKSFARGKFRIKKWGKQRIIRVLQNKNISEHHITAALQEIDNERYVKTIYQIATQKNRQIQEENLWKRKKKLADFLAQKGYEFELIFSVVHTVTETNHSLSTT